MVGNCQKSFPPRGGEEAQIEYHNFKKFYSIVLAGYG